VYDEGYLNLENSIKRKIMEKNEDLSNQTAEAIDTLAINNNEGTLENNKEEKEGYVKRGGKIRIDYLIDDIDNKSGYVKEWIDEPFMNKMRADPSFRRLLNHNKLEKEMNESYMVYQQTKNLLKKIGKSADDDDIVIFDVCSGKGFTSVLLSLHFPKARIYMIDKCTKMNLEHLTSLPQVTFENFNVTKSDMLKFVNDRAQGKFGLFLGVHLCGGLSVRFIDIYNRCEYLRAMVLSPCCLDKRNTKLLQLSKTTKIDNYQLWTTELYWQIIKSEKDIKSDDRVETDRDKFIVAIKHDNFHGPKTVQDQ
jgi:hypothetical protein